MTEHTSHDQEVVYRTINSDLSRRCYYANDFFAQSMHIKLALTQAAWLSIFFVGKSVVFHLLDGPELRTHF